MYWTVVLCNGGCSWKCYKTLTFCSLLTRCTIPCACHAKQHLNLQKWSESLVFSTFWLRNVLRATTACTFSTSELPKVVRMVVLTFWLRHVLRATTACTFLTSQLPKVVRQWCVLYILTSKCALRHNGVHFLDIATSKSGPRRLCFVHFDFEMCFAPQRRALFRHLNFQKRSEAEVFCNFDLEMCFAPQRRAILHLSSGQLEPTFRPSGAKNHWKNTMFCDFPTFSRICIFFPLTLSLLLFSLLIFLFSLPLPYSAFHLSILSEVWLLNFLRIPVVPHKAVAEVSKIGNL